MTARPQILLTNVASILVGFSMYAQSLVIPQLLQLPSATGYGLGQSMIQMGLWMAPAGLMMMVVAPIGPKLSAIKGPKVTLTLGGLVIAVAYAAAMPVLGSTWGLLVLTLICGSGIGLAHGSMPALIMAAVPQSETASANSFNTLMRSIGTSIAAAVIGVVLAQLTSDFGEYSLPSLAGFRVTLLIGAGVALTAAAISALVPTASKTLAPQEQDAPVPA